MRYTDSHEWIHLSGNKGKVGISKHAQKELGEIVYIELPKLGEKVSAGDPLAVLESTKAAADIYSPVSSRVVSINEAVKENPALLNESPEDKGWVCELEIDTPEDVEKLLTEEAYTSLIDSSPTS